MLEDDHLIDLKAWQALADQLGIGKVSINANEGAFRREDAAGEWVVAER